MVDCDKKARLQRAIEIAEGVEPPPGFISRSNLPTVVCANNPAVQIILQDIPRIHSQVCRTAWLVAATGVALSIVLTFWLRFAGGFHSLFSAGFEANYQLLVLLGQNGSLRGRTVAGEQTGGIVSVARLSSGRLFVFGVVPQVRPLTACAYRAIQSHVQVCRQYITMNTVSCSYLFFINNSLFLRLNSFDSHDPGVYTSKTVTGLLEHYKDPTCVMFFEPALTLPLNRNVVFSLQQLCRATIVSHTTYDGVNDICLPKKLKSYLKEYHYKQLVRIQRFDEISSGTWAG